jgi:hypothetical protein
MIAGRTATVGECPREKPVFVCREKRTRCRETTESHRCSAATIRESKRIGFGLPDFLGALLVDVYADDPVWIAELEIDNGSANGNRTFRIEKNRESMVRRCTGEEQQ